MSSPDVVPAMRNRKRLCEYIRTRDDPATVMQLATSVPVAWIVMRGYAWVEQTLRPALRCLAKLPLTTVRRRLLGRGHALIGDLLVVLRAERMALKQYKQALGHVPDSPEILFDIGQTAELCGHPRVAVRAHDLALQLDSGFEQSALARGALLEDLKRGDRGMCIRFDAQDAACEALAKGNVRGAMDLVRGRRSHWARMIRMRAYSILEQNDRALVELRSICHREKQLKLSSIDWFYLPDALFDEKELWQLLYAQREKIRDLGVMNFSPYSGPIGPPELRINDPAWQRKCTGAVLRLHFARTTHNVRGVQSLCRRFPKWGDALLVQKYYADQARMPSRAALASLAMNSARAANGDKVPTPVCDSSPI